MYSVNDYINTVKSVDDSLGSLAASMQNYGAWARQYLINAGKITEAAEIATPTVVNVRAEDLAPYAAVKSIGFNVSDLSISLFVESETTLRLYFSGDPAEVTAMADGEAVTLFSGTKDSRSYVEVRNISAKDLDKKITFNFGNGQTAYISPLSYAYAIVSNYENNSSKADICNTVKALFRYNQASKAFFENSD